MKKRLLLFLATSVAVSASAQTKGWKSPAIPQAQKQMTVQLSKEFASGHESPKSHQLVPNSQVNHQASRATTETVLGVTRWDLQTNSAIQRRIVNHGNGTLSAVWTYAVDNAWNNRGTGYSYFDGTSWSAAPTAPIESERVGWPNIHVNNSGTEVLIAHNTLNDVARKSTRNTVGSGNWTQSNETALDIEVWTRSAIAGPNDNTIHLVGLTLPIANDGNIYSGMDGALLYNRSDDGGQTWSIQNVQLPGMTSLEYLSIDADAYSIDAQGNTVVIVQATFGTGVQMWKSTDNGNNWTKTEIVATDYGLFDESTVFVDAVLDSAQYGSAGTCHVLLDQNDEALVFFDRQFMSNDNLGDDILSFYPFQNGIEFWKESWGDAEPVTIAGAPDLDGDGQLTIDYDVDGYRFTGLAAYPSAGIDANGNIYMVYSAVNELRNNLTQTYRQPFVVKSTDGGCSWTEPLLMTPGVDHDFDECMYASVARLVDNQIHMVYQRDFEPGLGVNGDEDPVSDNDIIYLSMDATDPDANPAGFCYSEIHASATRFCPGDSVLLEAPCGSSYTWTVGSNTFTTQSIYVSTYGPVYLDIVTPCGTLSDTVDLDQPLTGPNVQITANTFEICPGDTSFVAATFIPGATYQWDSGLGTANTATITATGTYNVSITDCGGTSVETVIISVPGAPTATILGQSEICPGDSVLLSANNAPGASYLWSTGQTTQEIWVFNPGVFNVQVSNCGGSATDAFTVSSEPAPTAVVNASGATSFCAGESVTLTASGGDTYLWNGPNGFQSGQNAITVTSDSGNYTLTAFNACGDSAVSAPTNITIYPLPATPIITYNGGNTFTSSSATGNQWYINGTPVPNATNQTFTPDPSTIVGQLVTVRVTDVNGCESDPSGGVVGIDDPQEAFAGSFSVYPNPNNGVLFIEFNQAHQELLDLQILNIIGQPVLQERVNARSGDRKSLDLRELPKGVYVLKLSNSNYESSRKVVLK